MTSDAGNETQGDGSASEWESAITQAAQDFLAAGRIENADIRARVADAVTPIVQRSDPAQLIQAVSASLTPEEFLTLKLHFGDRLSVEQIAQRQGRDVDAVRSEIAHSTALIRMHRFDRSAEEG